MYIKTQSKDRKILLIISAIAFFVLGFINLNELYFQFMYGFTAVTELGSFLSVIYWVFSLLCGLAPVGCIILSLGIFFGKKTPMVVGSGINVLFSIFSVVLYNILGIFKLGDLTPLLAWLALILLFFFKDKYSIFWGIGAAIARLLVIVFVSSNSVAILDVILFAIGAVVFSITRMPNSLKSNFTPCEATYDVKKGAETMLKLKKLLDDGIITQEEFDAKKKQLLGL